MDSSYPGEIGILHTVDQFAATAAELFVDLAAQAIQARGRFRVALTGGSAPPAMNNLLARPEYSSRIDWEKIDIFWGDERYVPSDDPESNYRMTAETLLRRVPLPEQNIYRVMTEIMPPAAAASNYEERIRRCFGHPASLPRFDLIYLGLGRNGHVASLFPHSPALRDTSRLVVADLVAAVSMWRISMTLPLLNRGRTVAFLVHGAEKAEILREVVMGPRDPERLPAQLIAPEGRLLWLTDDAAAAQLATGDHMRRTA